MKHKKQPVKVNPEIMEELLAQPEVARETKNLTPDELEFFKRMLVKQGIYSQYVKERKYGRRV